MQKHPKRILMVDDRTEILRLVKLGLEMRDFIVDTYSNPLQAAASFEAGNYDFALLDIDMPEMTGFELYRLLLKKDPELRVCFFTAYEHYRDQFRKEFPEIQSDCFLKKPMSIGELAGEINKFLDKEGVPPKAAIPTSPLREVSPASGPRHGLA